MKLSKIQAQEKIKRFPKSSLSPRQADRLLHLTSLRKSLTSRTKFLRPQSPSDFEVAKLDDAAELRSIKPNLAKNTSTRKNK